MANMSQMQNKTHSAKLQLCARFKAQVLQVCSSFNDKPKLFLGRLQIYELCFSTIGRVLQVLLEAGACKPEHESRNIGRLGIFGTLTNSVQGLLIILQTQVEALVAVLEKLCQQNKSVTFMLVFTGPGKKWRSTQRKMNNQMPSWIAEK